MTPIPLPVSLTIVIPCYNEAARIDLLYEGMAAFLAACEGTVTLIIVDDGSTDDTGYLLARHRVYDTYKHLIRLLTQPNKGKGAALQQGVQAATGEYVLTLDADMATSPLDLLDWLHSWGGTIAPGTVFIGSREHPRSVLKHAGNRKFIGHVFNRIIRLLTPLQLNDTQCGFKLYPALAAKKHFHTLQTPGWAHDVELLYKMQEDGLRIVEMPITWSAVPGSKIRVLRDGWRMLVETIHIVMRQRRGKP